MNPLRCHRNINAQQYARSRCQKNQYCNDGTHIMLAISAAAAAAAAADDAEPDDDDAEDAIVLVSTQCSVKINRYNVIFALVEVNSN